MRSRLFGMQAILPLGEKNRARKETLKYRGVDNRQDVCFTLIITRRVSLDKFHDTGRPLDNGRIEVTSL